jgi:carboxypeptidase PM20D1
MRGVILIISILFYIQNQAFAQVDVEFVNDISIATSNNKIAASVQRLSEALTFKTVSSDREEQFEYAEFEKLHQYLQEAFPAMHERLQREVINGYSLLYTWIGEDTDLLPVLLSAHMDVVPVEEVTEEQWQEKPYSGVVKDGYIWGRGAMDDKYRVLAIMEAVEQLVQEGYKPERTIYLAFGHDEEVGGDEGSGKISTYLAQQNVLLEAVFDEGLAIAMDVLPGIKEPIALIGTAAKGNLNLRLTARGEGGHSSVPPQDTPIDILSTAIRELHQNPFKARMTSTTKESVTAIANKMGGKYKFAMRHYGLFKGKVLKKLAKDRATDALIRTQMSPTVIEAGDKSNVLPRVATAIINIRILNGENMQTVMEHVTKTINDERVQIETYGIYTPPSPVTSTDTWTYKALEQAIGKTFPEVDLVVPTLFPGATDARHYTNLTNNIYRFAPQVVTREDAKLVHNVDERLSVEVYSNCIAFYDNLIRFTCGSAAEQLALQQEEPDLPFGVNGE